MPRPAGSMRPFCEPRMAKSTPQSSNGSRCSRSRRRRRHRAAPDAWPRPWRGGHIAGDAGGGLVVHHERALDLVGLVGAQRLLDAFGVGAGAPFLVLHDDIETVPLGELDPQMAELAEASNQNLVARSKRVGERRFPGAGAARRPGPLWS